MPLNPAQKQAVEYLEGPLLVLAGPGTGKTQLLSAKVAYILENTDAMPDNILCLTFTDAGAENMRDRLQSMIGKAASKVNIHTYHAFGKTVIDRYQNYAETPTRQIETAVDETMQHQIIARIQKNLPAFDILRKTSIKDIIDTINNAKSARLSADDLQKIAEQNLADGEKISAIASPILAAATPRARVLKAIEETYQPLLEALAKLITPEPIVGNIERIANTMCRSLKTALDEVTAMDKPKKDPISSWQKKYFTKDENNADRLKDQVANKKLLSLARIMREYETYLDEHKLCDYSDMIEEAIKSLQTDRGFKLSLHEQFQYILLDEFQDTNTSQFQLIKLLTDYEKPIIMAVGDDDQAIYAFQGANASNLMDFREHYDAEVISLTTNYRSTGEVLALSRHIADQITDSFAKTYPSVTKVLTSFKDETSGAPKHPQISRHEFSNSSAEYYWVAAQIRELLAAGTKPDDIAILAPKHQALCNLLPYLKSENIEITYEKRDNLFLDEKCHALITTALFIHDLASGKRAAERLLEILSFPFWGISASAAVNLFSEKCDHHNRKPTLQYLQDAGFTELADFFANLVAEATTAPLELWLARLIGLAPLGNFTSPFLAYYQKHLTDAELLEFYESLNTLRQTVLMHASGLGQDQTNFVPHLADFATTIRDYEEADKGITRVSIYRDSDHAVQVMTAFKSKGLEFKHVFLTSVDDTCWGMGKGNNNKLSLPQNLIQIRHTGATDDERLRLLFVAITRAKDYLVMTNSRTNDDGKKLNRLSYLNESSYEDVVALSPYLPESAQTIQDHTSDLTDHQKIQTLALAWASHYTNPSPDFNATAKARVANYHLSASDLTSFLNLAYSGPQALYTRLILNAPQPPSTPEQLYGTLIHKVYEKIITDQLSDEAACDFFNELIPATDLTPEDQATLREFGLHNLRISLQAFGPLLRNSQAKAKAEVNLASEHPILNGVPLTGKLDLIIRDPKAKTIEIYDYKTGAFRKGKWDSHPTIYSHRLQLGFYKLLLNLSPSYANYTVTKGHILYVTPDNDGEVHDKVYDYNADDETELKLLIEKVYHLITSLDFFQKPEFFLAADRSYGMKQVREFVAQILAS